MSNRAAKYEQLYKSLKKNFKPVPEVGERSVLEHMIYACCLEDARADQADEAFAKLQQAYFDWNEVRVTTVIELGEALSSLPNAAQAGHRIKRCLQSLFEARYQYDIEDMKKANLGKATDELTAWKGVTPFILNYVSQNALGGHSIPVDTTTLEVLVQADIITQAEAEKKSLPGIERAIAKNKGLEFASLLHQFAMDFSQNAKNANALAVFKELGVTPKPKVAPKPVAAKESKGAVKAAAAPETDTTKSKSATVSASPSKDVDATSKKTDKPVDNATSSTAKSKEPAAAKSVSSKPEPAKVDVKKKSDTKPPEPKKVETKKAEPKKPEAKSPDLKKSEPKKEVAKKPADKKVDAKPAAKKPSEPAAKKTDAKPAAKKPSPAESKKPSKPALPKPKAPAPKPATKSSSKPSPNVKITKKKPR